MTAQTTPDAGPRQLLTRIPWDMLPRTPGWRASALASALLGATASLLTIAQPLVLAPAVSAAFRSLEPAATGLSSLSLNNLGVTMAAYLGWDLRGEAFQVVLFSVGVYAVVVALTSGLNLATARLGRRLQWRVTSELQLFLLRQILSKPMSFFRSQRSGQLTTRIVSGSAIAASMLHAALRGVWESCLQLLLFGFLLLRTDMTLALTVGTAVVMHVLVSRALQGRLALAARTTGDAPAALAGSIHEVLGGARIVKAFAAEGFEQSRLTALLAMSRESVLRTSLPADSEGPLRDVVNAFAGGIAVVVASAALSSGRLTFPGFVLFVFAARQTIIPFSRLATATAQLSAGAEAGRRLFSLLAIESPLHDGAREPAALQTAITFNDVSFSYAGGEPVLKSISLTIPRGARVALVGPSGVGKSTLADLVLRLEDPTRGQITYDGIDIRDFRQASYRRRFGVVSQEVVLFHTSVVDNIAYGRPLAWEDVERAAMIANATDFIKKLPHGYDTVIGERGSRLSGGERQRLAIARAIYGRPDVLVLDEATAALDTSAERIVQAAIESALEGTTALVIAHRLSTIVGADLILVLDQGQVVASGRHEELLGTSSLYRQLWESQFWSARVSGDAPGRLESRWSDNVVDLPRKSNQRSSQS